VENIIMIGMPGCGKSTIGVVLAKVLGMGFMDSDLVIQSREGKLLHDIIKEQGMEKFLEIEDKINSEIVCDRVVISTGGSVVYGKNAMEHLKKIGMVVYIKLPYEDIKGRLGNLENRGVAIKDGYSLKDLYDERTPLYEQYADITAETHGLTIEQSVKLIEGLLENYKKIKE